MPRQNKQLLTLNEKGFASIVIALVMIIILALVTVGFAQLARREQRDALNKQLANQAYFAAESGINDVVKALPALVAQQASIDPTKCLDTSQFSLSPTINSAHGVSYSCVLVNLKPPNIQYSNVPAGSERHILFSTEPSPLNSLTVSWGSADGNTTPRSGTGFPPLVPPSDQPSNKWGDSPAVLEVSLTPMPAVSSNASLVANTFTVYLYPSSTAGGVVFNTGSQGQVTNGGCHGTGTYTCSATISGIPASVNGKYLIRIGDYYNTSNISITGQTPTGKASFIGQTQIDVTGKAQEVLKRIQVRVPNTASYDLPHNSIEVQSGCKRFTTDPVNAPVFDTPLNDACNIAQ